MPVRTTRSGTLVVGRPGSSAHHMARRRAMNAAGSALAGLVCLALALRWHWWMVFGAPVAAAVAHHQWGLLRRALVGARSERTVGKALEGSGAAAVLHGVDLGSGGDADHVVLGPVVAVVETKTGRGAVRVDGSDVWVGNHLLARNPLTQAQHQARLLGAHSRCYVDAVACIVDMDGPPRQVGHAWLCSAAQLPSLLRSFRPQLDADGARSLAQHLASGPTPPRR